LPEKTTLYKFFLRPLAFLLPAEKAHYTLMSLFSTLRSIPPIFWLFKKSYHFKDPVLTKELMGLRFENPVGLAAGFDKDARWIDALAGIGFGFIEIGTLTPKGQSGNAKPRLFRLKKDDAIINRMGFNNQGVFSAIERLKKRKSRVIVGGNIGKNKDTPNEQAAHDYQIAFEALFDYVDYFVVNVSSPNTPGLRALQDRAPLEALLLSLIALNKQKPTPKPLLLKIAPDLSDAQVVEIAQIANDIGLHGVIATNTTVDRQGLVSSKELVEKIGMGGLSGPILAKRSTEVIALLRKNLSEGKVIIGVGGIDSGEDALEKIRAGADLVQIYTGFIYQGPGLVKRIKQFLAQSFSQNKVKST